MSALYKSVSLLIGFILFFIGSGCSDNKSGLPPETVAQINEFSLSREEFQKKLVKELEYMEDFKTTPQAKREFLQSLIEKELFIQEARRMGLDRRQAFVDAIERYWEATLIKLLMETKSQEIRQVASISDQEIKTYYKKLKAENMELPPLDQIEEKLAGELAEIKKTEMMDKWIKSLRQNARIKINDDFLNE